MNDDWYHICYTEDIPLCLSVKRVSSMDACAAYVLYHGYPGHECSMGCCDGDDDMVCNIMLPRYHLVNGGIWFLLLVCNVRSYDPYDSLYLCR